MLSSEAQTTTTSSYSPEFKDPTPAGFREVDATHAPLLSAAYFVQAQCGEFNDDFMLCKRDNADPAACAVEGRRVTRCVRALLASVEQNCGQEYTKHWQCLRDGNNYYWRCRDQERQLNQCVYKKMQLQKQIPNAPDFEVPIHMRTDTWYSATSRQKTN